MGFDQNSAGQPLVNVHKKTTQVNLWMVAGVVMFFLVCATVLFSLSRRHGPDDPKPPEAQAAP